MNPETKSENLTIISRRSSYGGSQIAELWRSRDLILLFVKRDFVTLYKQTILGPLWFLIQPLLITIVFTVVFGRIAKIPTDGIPPFLFYLSGVVPWTYFSSNAEKNSGVFLANQGIFAKVYFPRLTIPIATTISNFFTFCIQFLTFLVFFIYFLFSGSDFKYTWWVFLIVPLILIQCMILGMGVGLCISALTTKYRDLTFIVGFGLQLWMYATPIVYPLSQASNEMQLFLALNPMSNIVELFRYTFFGVGSLNFLNCIISSVTSCAIFLIGIKLFYKVERTFIDTI